MTGGSASGKGFVLSDLIGVEGRTFNSDNLHEFVKWSSKINKRVLEKYGIDTKKLDQNNPDHTSKLYDIVNNKLKLSIKVKDIIFYTSMLANPERKPNLIFDITLDSMGTLASITNSLKTVVMKAKISTSSGL